MSSCKKKFLNGLRDSLILKLILIYTKKKNFCIDVCAYRVDLRDYKRRECKFPFSLYHVCKRDNELKAASSSSFFLLLGDS